MTDTVVRTERRSAPRYIVDRDCAIFALDTRTEVTLLNVSLIGIATLGPALAVSPGDRIVLCIGGLSTLLDAIVVNVNYGRIGARFDLAPEAQTVWESEFAEMIVGAEAL